MKHLLKITVAGIALTAGTAFAGGIERSSQSVGVLFEEGTYGEVTFSTVSPSVSGTFGGVIPSGDMAASYQNYSFSYKQDLGENLSFALIVDQPIGANVAYPSAGAYPFAGSTATLNSHAVTGFLRYKFPSNVSIYGGLRAQSVTADLNVVGQAPLPGVASYSLHVGTDIAYGYAFGVAYEKPEIALRIALTHNSEITHSLSDNAGTSFDVIIPKSWNLEFQSGVAKDTLVFGSIRWVEWTAFNISPPDYALGTLADGKSNTISYTLGVGRKFSDKWSGAVILGYENDGGVPVGNLGPTDGNKSIGLAATYKVNNVKITGGIRYIKIGDATTTSIGSNFAGNSAIAMGLKIGVNF
ncbi:hypothetical protein JI58_06080 [Marinosulfonomonas sp. PRT-SC04]|nr:hypothetical protein JI58_06080 [Marinosulfonomonas sp. PRT-SC04]